MNFWDKLFSEKKMVLGLSPMDGVTDVAMRYMVAKYGRKQSYEPCFSQSSELGGVDVLFTEFVNVDGLHYAEGERRERLLKTLLRASDVDTLQGDTFADAKESPWPYEVAQIFGKNPELFAEAATLTEQLGLDGIDINMGCPAHKVEENGCGAGLIRTPALAQEIIKTVQKTTKLPVSVKTRIGVVEKSEMEEWIEALVEVKPAVISLHGRTLKQMYTGSADWEAIGRAAEIVHRRGGKILGNGDVKSIQDAKIKVQNYGVDGVLIGRGAEGNPGVFIESQSSDHSLTQGSELREQRLAWAVEHAKIFEEIFWQCHSDTVTQSRAFMPMRKHLAWYCKGFEGAVELRMKLMQTNSAREVEEIVNIFQLSNHSCQ